MKDLVDDIENCRQNHPELIVRDLEKLYPSSSDNVRHILKYRGVNKWLRVRRLLISLKHRWLSQIKEIEDLKREAKTGKDWKTYYKLKGYGECLKDCRQQVRALCHSPRDVDFPELNNGFGGICELPENYPRRPKKRWFLKNGRV